MALAPRRLASLFDDFFEPRMFSLMPRADNDVASAMMQWRPSCDVRETDNAYLIHAEIPGAQKEDVKVELEGQRLKISGSVKEEKKTENDRYHSQERSFGKFMRVFSLPQNAQVDQISAKHENGVLELTIPKQPMEQTKARQIKVQ